MTGERPKIQIIGGDAEAVQDLANLVGGRFEIVTLPAGTENAPGNMLDNAAELLLDAVGEAACIADRNRAVAWSNRSYRDLDEQVRRQVEDIKRQVRQQLEQQSKRRNKPAGPRSWSFEGGDRAGETHYQITVSQVDHNSNGEQSALAVVLRDVSEQKRTQQKMDAIHRAGYELAHFDPEEIMKMNGMERMKLLETKITNTARELLNFDHYAIFLHDDKRDRLQLVMSEGLPPEIEDLDLFVETDGSGISGHVAATGQSYICYDAQTDERYLPGMMGARSSLTVPLLLHDHVMGILDIESSEPGQFDEQDRQFVEIFARHIAMTLHLFDLLVAERCDVNAQVSGRFEGELSDPLADIDHEIDWLSEATANNPEMASHLARLHDDVTAIRTRIKDMAEGPQSLLGVEKFREQRGTDPILEGKRVLIADDQKKIRKIIGEILDHRGAHVTVCCDGGAAIEAIEQAGRDGAIFDLVISDIQMPDRNGYEVFNATKTHCPDAPVILMTGFGYDPHHSIVRASQDGLHSVLFKPFEIELLMQQVRSALQPEHAAG